MIDEINSAPTAGHGTAKEGRNRLGLNAITCTVVWVFFDMARINFGVGLMPALLRGMVIIAIGTAVGSAIASLFSKKLPRVKAEKESPSIAPGAPRCSAIENGPIVLDPGNEPCPMIDERIRALPVAAVNLPSDAEWHVIHAGKELGPCPLAELVEKAVAGEIEANELVKQTGGLWSKASEFAFLRRQFPLNNSKEDSLKELVRFHGIWLSKKILAIGGCVALCLIGLLWAIGNRPPHLKPEGKQVANVPQFQEPTPLFSRAETDFLVLRDLEGQAENRFEQDRDAKLAEAAERQARNKKRAQEIASAIGTLDNAVPSWGRDQWRSFSNPFRLGKLTNETTRDLFFEFLVNMEMNEQTRIRGMEGSAASSNLSVRDFCATRGYPLPEDHGSGAWKILRDNLAELEFR